MLFIGYFSYRPNARAAQFLIDELVPGLSDSLGDFELLLVGPSPTDKMLSAAAKDPRIKVPGEVEDLGKFLAVADVSLVPLFSGSGTRLKVLESFASEIPVISTSKGVEGLNATPGHHFILAESAADFTRQLILLHDSLSFREQLSSVAYELVDSAYSSKNTLERISGALRNGQD